MDNGNRFSRIKRKNSRRRVSSSQYYEDIGSVKKRKIFLRIRARVRISHECDAQKTAFSTPHGHYHFNRMPFGLERDHHKLMDQVLSGLQRNDMFVYLDDTVIYASSLEEH